MQRKYGLKSDRQVAFVEEYLVDLNATQAAIRAGYSKKTATSVANENLTKPDIKQAIQLLMKERSEKTGITADAVISELAKIAFSSMRDYMSWYNGGVTINDSEELTQGKDKPVSSVKLTESATTGQKTFEIKLHNKVQALELLGKHLGIFNDRLKIDIEHQEEPDMSGMTSEEIEQYAKLLRKVK